MSERNFSRSVARVTLPLSLAGFAACLASSLAHGAETGVTFSKDIAPIFQRACQNCHRPGAIAPMSLLTYKDTRPWARSIKVKVVKRQMPPWHIDRNVGITKFKDNPSLTDAEVATISAWVDQGAPKGNPADMPPPREFTDLDKWHMGKPDVVVTMPTPYVLKATGGDEYYDVEVDPGFKEDVYVSAVETKPDLGFAVIHHCTTNLVEDPVDDPVGLFLNEYAVGKNADIFPTSSGRLIKAGSKIHFNVHLHPDGKATPVQISLGVKLYPKDVVPKYIAFTQHMGDVADLDLPAGQITRNDGYFRLPRPAVMTAYQPHFHIAGQSAMHRSDLSRRASRLRASRSRENRHSELRQRLPVRLEHHVQLRRGRLADSAGGNDDSRDHLARQHRQQYPQSESEELGGRRATNHRRDEFRVGQLVLH